MLKITQLAHNRLKKVLQSQQKDRIIVNKKQISDYYNNNITNLTDNIEVYKYEKEILFMIKYSVSMKFICNYLNISSEIVKNIAIENKCYSQLLSNYTENVEARCFSKNQILRSCEDMNYICPMCLKTLDITKINDLTGHHILPYAKDGKTYKDNCLPLHKKCHFEEFKLLHYSLFEDKDPIYLALYFNNLKNNLQNKPSGMFELLNMYVNNNIQ